MNTMIKATLLAAGMATAIGGFAYAEGGKGKKERVSFEQLDTDQDGFVTMEEIEAQKKARFDAQDTDGSGTLSQAEVVAAITAKMEEMGRDVDQERIQERVAKMFDKRDANEDGVLEFGENSGKRDPSKMFDRADENGDGKISSDEFEAVKGKHKGKRNKRDGKKSETE